MISIYIIFLLFLIFFMIRSWILILTKRKEFHLFVTPAFICSILLLIVSGVIAFCKSEALAYALNILIFIIIDGLVYSIYQFSKSYVQAKINIWYVRYFLLLLLTLDLIFLISNYFNHFYFELIFMTSKNGLFSYWQLNVKAPMIFHYAICGIIIILTELFLIKKMHSVPSFYKKKYYLFVSIYFCVALLSYICNIFKLPQDYSIYFYPLVADAVFNYSLLFADKIIKEIANQNLIDKSSKPVFFFELQNKFVYANLSGQELMEEINFNKNEIELFLKKIISKNFARNLDIAQSEELIETNNKKYYLEVTYKKAFYEEAYIGAFLEIVDKTEERLKIIHDKQVSSHDELTGLYNKNAFFELCQAKLSDEPEAKWIMLASKIIDFKIINTFFGKEVCDNILKLQAKFVKQLAHSSTIVGHIYDDNFALLMKKEYFDEQLYINKLLEISRIANNFYYYMNIYIGVYEKSNVSENVQYMYDKAILAIDKRPENSVKRICYYSNSIMKNFLSERNFISDFNFAINSSQFLIFLQPIFNVYPNIIGVQTLVRWNKPESGLLTPKDFLSVFEHTEIIYKLDLYVWEKSVQQLVRWHKLKIDNLFVSVTISSNDFDYIDIAKIFEGFLQQYDIIPKNLKICIEEEAFINHFDQVSLLIPKLHSLGYEIGIIGFGNRHFSFKMITKNDIDFIIIDLRYFRSNKFSEKSAHIFESLIKLSEDLGFKIIIDGIENEKQHKLLQQSNCKLCQGDFYVKPLSRFDFERQYL